MANAHVRQIRVMISSTRQDLAQYREEASTVIKKVNEERKKQFLIDEVSMERESQTGDREFPIEVSKDWVKESDWVILIVGWNYGTISDEPGANDLSVTEWEYNQATGDPNKKIFVFIAGEAGTPDQYRVSPEERQDLKDWRGTDKQTQEQWQKLQEFRRKLGKRHLEMFANLRMFRERLEKGLQNALDGLLPQIQPGTPLAEVIVSVTPEFQDCIRKVTLIADCKLIHDCLHELLQQFIRPLREEVLSVWKQGESLTRPQEKSIDRFTDKASEQLATIGQIRNREEMREIGREHRDLCITVEDAVTTIKGWKENWYSADSSPSRDEFNEVVDDLARLVERAFGEADQSMVNEERALSDHYSALQKRLEDARQHRALSLSDHQQLDDEFEKIDTNKKYLENTLDTHHRWQKQHDELHHVDCNRDAPLFGKELNFYRKSWLPRLQDLSNDNLGEAHVDQPGAAEAGKETVGTVCKQNPQTSLPDCPDTCVLFADNVGRLEKSIQALRQSEGEEASKKAFDEMLKPFEDAFYCVDKRTLRQVNHAKKRVEVMERWLNSLVTGPR